MIGTAIVADDYPLYFDAVNEEGLCAAGLNFPNNAVYHSMDPQKCNIASFEVIPWILSQCKTVSQVKLLLQETQVTDDPFRKDVMPTPLHWIISDATESIVVESMADGLHIDQNTLGILTNNPPFDFHCYNMANYGHLMAQQAENTFSRSLPVQSYSNGMGSIGLPGDLSSASRFVRASFMKEHSLGGSVEQDITQFFHILDSVAMPKGSVITPDGRYEFTRYSSCCDTVSGKYFYKTYEDSRISFIDLHAADLGSSQLQYLPMLHDAVFFQQS
jgi:choloylglycine hydrolase